MKFINAATSELRALKRKESHFHSERSGENAQEWQSQVIKIYGQSRPYCIDSWRKANETSNSNISSWTRWFPPDLNVCSPSGGGSWKKSNLRCFTSVKLAFFWNRGSQLFLVCLQNMFCVSSIGTSVGFIDRWKFTYIGTFGRTDSR